MYARFPSGRIVTIARMKQSLEMKMVTKAGIEPLMFLHSLAASSALRHSLRDFKE